MENSRITTILKVPTINSFNIDEAYKIFNTFKEQKIILNSKWSDKTWYLTDEYSNVNFHFRIDSENIFDMPNEKLEDYIKAYSCFLLSRLSLISIQKNINEIKRFSTCKVDFRTRYTGEIENFLSMIDIDDDLKEELFDKLDDIEFYEDKSGLYNGGKRHLCSFKSYFILDDIMGRFWKDFKDNDELRLFYFPLYFWWKITGAVSQRPKEMLLTSRLCLSKKNDKYFLKVRRDKLKGKNKSVSYKIDQDFWEDTYQIPDEIAKDIEWYLDKTKDMEETEINTLFVLQPHYKRFGRSVGLKNRFFTRINMTRLLIMFYEEIVIDYYGYELIADKSIKSLEDNQIQLVSLGDARHISSINMILEGLTPTNIMYLMGHDNPEMSANYYSNVIQVIHCKTDNLYRGSTKYKISEYNSPRFTKNYTILEDGVCLSEKFNSDSPDETKYEDCINAYSERIVLGDCNNCPYFKRKRVVEKNFKDKFYNDYVQLRHVVNLLRKNKGSKEELITTLNKFSSSRDKLTRFLTEKRKWEETRK